MVSLWHWFIRFCIADFRVFLLLVYLEKDCKGCLAPVGLGNHRDTFKILVSSGKGFEETGAS